MPAEQLPGPDRHEFVLGEAPAPSKLSTSSEAKVETMTSRALGALAREQGRGRRRPRCCAVRRPSRPVRAHRVIGGDRLGSTPVSASARVIGPVRSRPPTQWTSTPPGAAFAIAAVTPATRSGKRSRKRGRRTAAAAAAPSDPRTPDPRPRRAAGEPSSPPRGEGGRGCNSSSLRRSMIVRMPYASMPAQRPGQVSAQSPHHRPPARFPAGGGPEATEVAGVVTAPFQAGVDRRSCSQREARTPVGGLSIAPTGFEPALRP